MSESNHRARGTLARAGSATIVAVAGGAAALGGAYVPRAAAQTVQTGPSTVQAPYVLPTQPGMIIKSIIGNGNGTTTPDETYAKTGGGTYRFTGIPDGLGAYDNGDGTMTVLSNHELGNTSGVVRDHGSVGAFVSEWVINKSTLQVVRGGDLMKTVNLWNTNTSSYVAAGPGQAAFGRLCSADLAAPTAFFNAATGMGTTNRIFLNGEENGINGRSMAHVATGAAKGTSYELPRLGKWSVENNLANPLAQDKTIVMGNADDAANPALWMYVGTKQNTGTDVDRAGLTNGTVSVLKVNGVAAESRANALGTSTFTGSVTFSFASLGDVSNTPAAQQQSTGLAAGATTFMRAEDGAWDPRAGKQNNYYFVTTDRFNTITNPSTPGGPAAQEGRSRLWRMTFSDISSPTNGGSIQMLLDAADTGHEMFDNMAIDSHGRILLNEDPGNTAYRGRVWVYNIDTGDRGVVAQFDPALYGNPSGTSGTLTGGVAPFVTGTTVSDKETTGIIDAGALLGDGWFLMNVQAHYGQTGANAAELVEGGQMVAMFLPTNIVPEPASLGCAAAAGAIGLLARRRRRETGGAGRARA